MLIYWANDVYKIDWGDTTLLHFFPDSFYSALHFDKRSPKGWPGIFCSHVIVRDQWRVLRPLPRFFRESGAI